MGIPHLEVHTTSIGSYEKFDKYIDIMNKIIMMAVAICCIAELCECGKPCSDDDDCKRSAAFCYPEVRNADKGVCSLSCSTDENNCPDRMPVCYEDSVCRKSCDGHDDC